MAKRTDIKSILILGAGPIVIGQACEFDYSGAQLPAPNLSTSYVFATGDSFFAYPNNYNYYVQYYKDTFQHGGISMEEMLIPLITLTPRKR